MKRLTTFCVLNALAIAGKATEAPKLKRACPCVFQLLTVARGGGKSSPTVVWSGGSVAAQLSSVICCVRRRMVALVIILSCSPLLGGCSGSSTITPTTSDVQSLNIALDAAVGVGHQSHLLATARVTDGSSLNVTPQTTWQTSNPTVVTVSPTGIVSGVSLGTAVITGTYQGVRGTLTVTVITCQLLFSIGGQPTLYLNESILWYAEGQNTCDQLKSEPVTATWQSVNPDIVTVRADGASPESSTAQITGVAPGTATIVATSGDVQARGTVTVRSTVTADANTPPAHTSHARK
jgi:hypothetical protein